jgi:hypothetical protein
MTSYFAQFSNFIKSFTIGSNDVTTKMRRSKFSNKRNQKSVQKRGFGKFNFENDVIRDAHIVICKINLKIFGDIDTDIISAKNPEIA